MSNELQSKIWQLEDQIRRLENEREALREELIASFQEDAKAYVGKCYREGDKYAKIISPPLREFATSGVQFNVYQFPAIFLTTDLIPIKYGTFYIGPRPTSWIEVTSKEFDQVYEERIETLRGLLDRGVSSDVLERYGKMHPRKPRNPACEHPNL